MIPIVEALVVGVLLSALSTSIGLAIGKSGKLSKEDFQQICTERQNACAQNMCSELKHIKEEQNEMKKDIKELLKRVN